MSSDADISALLSPRRTLAKRLLTIGENRLELLAVELQEEREKLQFALGLALAIGVFGLLALFMLSGAIVVAFWAWSPVNVFLMLTALYSLAGVLFYACLHNMMRNWQPLSASIDQLRKDHVCLKKIFS